MTDFQNVYKALLFVKILPCGDFQKNNSSPLNIFCVLQENLFSLLIIISRDILLLSVYSDREL